MSGGYNLNQVNVYVPQYRAGYFRFNSGITSLPGIVNGLRFAGFLLGMADYAERSLVDGPSYFAPEYAPPVVSDQYQAAKLLTVSVGINMAVQNPRVEKYNRQSTSTSRRSIPRTVCLALWSAPHSPARLAASRPAIATFDPRVSIAWNPENHSDTVVRAAWSRGALRHSIYSNQWGTQAFNGRQTFLSPNSQLEPALTLSQGVPPPGYTLPNLSPSVANDSVADLLDTSHRLPLVQSRVVQHWAPTPAIARRFPLVLAYLRARSSDGQRHREPERHSVSALRYGNQLYDESFNASLRPYPQFKGFNLNSSYPLARYQRDAASVSIEEESLRRPVHERRLHVFETDGRLLGSLGHAGFLQPRQ